MFAISIPIPPVAIAWAVLSIVVGLMIRVAGGFAGGRDCG
jgi:hypothetical protein